MLIKGQNLKKDFTLLGMPTDMKVLENDIPLTIGGIVPLFDTHSIMFHAGANMKIQARAYVVACETNEVDGVRKPIKPTVAGCWKYLQHKPTLSHAQATDNMVEALNDEAKAELLERLTAELAAS